MLKVGYITLNLSIHKYFACFSVSDIVLDFILFLEYINGSKEFNDYFVEDQSSGFLGNASTVTCSHINSTYDGQERFLCVRYNYWFAILTLVFIYLPGVNVVATLYSPQTAGVVGIWEGIAMAILGGILATTGYFVTNPGAAIAGWFMVCLGAAVFVLGLFNFFTCQTFAKPEDAIVFGLGLFNYFSGEKYDEIKVGMDKYHWFFFIPLLICSPGIFIIIKLLAIVKANNQFIQSQATYGSRGEATLEAAPQLGLQLYIIILSMSATENQWLAIITSAATISLPCIENYISARGGDFGPKSIIKNIFVFLPACLFKILSVSILAVFLRWWAILVIVAVIIMVCVCLGIAGCFCDLPHEDVDRQHYWECTFLCWLTLAGLGRTKKAIVYTLLSTLLATIIYSLILVIIILICNFHNADLSWSDLEIVKDPLFLNILLGSTIGLGWISFLLDIILACCKSHDWRSHNWGPLKKALIWFVDPLDQEASFWDRAVLLQGVQYK